MTPTPATTPLTQRHAIPPAVLWLVGLAMVLVVLVSRFYDLGAKPAMHDESMFAFYAWQGVQGDAHYVHQAILHGPVQMLGIGAFFNLFGDSLASARAFIALWGVLAAAAGWLLAPRRTRWWWAGLWITSPIVIYYSRYLHEELIFNGAFLIGTAALARAMRRNSLGTIGMLLALTALLLVVARPGGKAEKLGALLLMGGAVCGIWGMRRDLLSVLLAGLGAVAMFFPLAVKENSLFVYASGFTFAGVWLAIEYGWRGAVPNWSWLPARLKPEPPRKQSVPRGAAERKSGREKRRAQPQNYLPPSFDQVTTPFPVAAPDQQVGERPPDQGWNGWLAKPLPVLIQAPLIGLGLLLGCWIVFWIYGTTRTESAADWGVGKIFRGAILNMRDSWDYWYEQHKLHRIEGPISYYLPIMAVYELPALLLLYFGLAWDATRRGRRLMLHLALLLAWVIVFIAWRALAPHLGPTSIITRAVDFLHIKPNGQMLLLGLLIAPLLAWSVLCLRQRLPLAGWLGWWAACSLFQYSSAGEKVPWLTANIVIPMYLALAWVWAPHVKSLGLKMKLGLAACVLLGTALGLRNSIHLMTDRAADPRERIVYNHTPPAFHKLAEKQIAEWAADPSKPLKERRVLLSGQVGWPGVWYFRNTTYILDGAPITHIDSDWDLIIADKALADPVLADLDLTQFSTQSLSLRDHWMVVWPDKAPLACWWNYYWSRQIWPPEPVTWPVTAIIPNRRP